MAQKIKVAIADDHPVVIQGLRELVEKDPDLELAGMATDGREALSLIESTNPDIAILDILMPHVDGVEVAHRIKENKGKTKIIIYSMSASKENIASLFRHGVSGYVLKEEPFSELKMAVKVVKGGAVFYSATVQDILQNHMKQLERGEGGNVAEAEDGIAKLSTREKEVFVLLADGVTIKDIAERLHISPKTVESHKYNIMDKLGVNSVAEFTKIAAKKGLIEI